MFFVLISFNAASCFVLHVQCSLYGCLNLVFPNTRVTTKALFRLQAKVTQIHIYPNATCVCSFHNSLNNAHPFFQMQSRPLGYVVYNVCLNGQIAFVRPTRHRCSANGIHSALK